ncbi:hypothetical protein PpBr36_04162 [Pyricularia pennisetigena]|uniref:hypothetical protein n=1 Tax=Pyricularia pennisetigena TaxID=1578925 RepID=UPI0011518AF6|nr:hypothetical protein PpBr36_04162 [Pyricularia pennisetigena]TLS27061.1 hypothetical protein PpBr36_04162 [Pyricularia pennisetigena]
MHFAKYASFIGALAGFAQASPAPFSVVNTPANAIVARSAAMDGDLEARSVFWPSKFRLRNSWENVVLFSGNAGNNLTLDLGLHKAAISGDISLKMTHKLSKEPTLLVKLGGLKGYFQVDLEASDATYETVELVNSGRLNIDIPGFSGEAGTAFALDLIVGVSAPLAVRGGFYFSFPKDSFVEISIHSKEVVRQSLDGLVAQPLDMVLGASVDLDSAVELTMGLRMRSAVGMSAKVDMFHVDSGVDVILWLDLFSYTTTIGRSKICSVFLEESFAMGYGLATEASKGVAKALKLEVAPMVFVTISRARLVGFCLINVGPIPGGLPSGPGSRNGTSGAGNSTSPGSGNGTSPGSGNGTSPGSGNSTAPGSGSGASSGAGSGQRNGTTGAGSSTAPSAGSGFNNHTLTHSTATGQITAAPSGYTTSTITETKTYTITSCAAKVKNCPASLTQQIVTSTVIETTTVCPVGETTTLATTVTQTTDCEVPEPTNETQVTTVTMTTCPAETSSYTEPEGVKTPEAPVVTITEKPACNAGCQATKAPNPIGTGGVYPPHTAGQSVPYPTQPTNTQHPVGGVQTGGLPPRPTSPPAVTTAPPVKAGAGRISGGLAAVVLSILATIL